MDATENDLPPSAPFRIAGFPTLKFKKAGSKDFIDYDGDRTLESLVAFIEENASQSLEKKNETVVPPPHAAEEAQEPIVHDHHDEL
jgi:protein disulfide-isomerase A1